MSALQDPRVLFAAERTLLAWNRTSLALVAFGFVVERAGILLAALAAGRDGASAFTFWLGLAFVALGVASALYATRQYALVLRTLTPAEVPAGYAPRWGMLVNAVVAVLGLLLMLALYLERG